MNGEQSTPAWLDEAIEWGLSLKPEERLSSIISLVEWLKYDRPKPEFADNLPPEYLESLLRYQERAHDDATAQD